MPHTPPRQERQQAEQVLQDPPPRQERHLEGRPFEDLPPWQERHQNRYFAEELQYGKLKFTMPKFSESNDPEEYLSWSLKVDKIFRLHNYDDEKKIAMASLEFQDYVLIW